MIDDVSAPHPIPSCPPSGRSPSRSCSSVTTQFQGELLANRTRGIASQDVGLIPPSLMMMVMMRGVLKCGCVCDDCEETRGPASSGSCAQGPSHSFQWRRSGGSSVDLPRGEWTWTWTGGMSQQDKTKQVLAFSLTIASIFSLSLFTFHVWFSSFD